ncbi:hypothetical protein pb186bvf_008067 [Paramecium bursaria]
MEHQCTHIDLVQFEQRFFCKKCGIYMPEDGTCPIKPSNMNFPGFLNPVQNLKKQWEQAVPLVPLPLEYVKQRPSLVEYMIEWSEKLKLSNNSLFLAVQFLDNFLAAKKVDPVQYKLYGATALMLAAKSIELDERIPFISKLRRFTYLPYGTSDFRKCECQLIKHFGWKLQGTTIIDWIESALSLGVVNEQEEIVAEVLKEKNTNIQRANTTESIKEHIENIFKKQEVTQSKYEKVHQQAIKLCILLLKENQLIDKDPADVTLSIIACARKSVGLKNLNTPSLQKLFDVQPQYIDTFTEQLNKSLVPKKSLDYFSLQTYKVF